MPREGLDREALHSFLFRRADSAGRLKIHQGELAEEIGIRFETVSRVFKEFQEQGRMRKLSTYKGNIALYQIVDPVVWRWRGKEALDGDTLFS